MNLLLEFLLMCVFAIEYSKYINQISKSINRENSIFLVLNFSTKTSAHFYFIEILFVCRSYSLNNCVHSRVVYLKTLLTECMNIDG